MLRLSSSFSLSNLKSVVMSDDLNFCRLEGRRVLPRTLENIAAANSSIYSSDRDQPQRSDKATSSTSPDFTEDFPYHNENIPIDIPSNDCTYNNQNDMTDSEKLAEDAGDDEDEIDGWSSKNIVTGTLSTHSSLDTLRQTSIETVTEQMEKIYEDAYKKNARLVRKLRIIVSNIERTDSLSTSSQSSNQTLTPALELP